MHSRGSGVTACVRWRRPRARISDLALHSVPLAYGGTGRVGPESELASRGHRACRKTRDTGRGGRLPPQQRCSPRRRPRRSPPQHSPVDSSCPSARSPASHTTGNQRRRGMTATAGGTTWRHRRGAPPSSHEPGQPPPRPHVAPPRPAPPAPRPRPCSAPGAKEARHDRTSTQGRTQFVACGRDSPAPEPCCERLLPALKGRDPGAADRGPLRAGSPSSAPPSAHPLRAFRKTSAARGKARVRVGSYRRLEA